MVTRKTTTRRRKKKTSRKQSVLPNFARLLLFFLLFLLLVFSLCSAGYVIFFRTVSAQEIMGVHKNSIAYTGSDLRWIKAARYKQVTPQRNLEYTRQLCSAPCIQSSIILYSSNISLMLKRTLPREHHGDLWFCFITGLNCLKVPHGTSRLKNCRNPLSYTHVRSISKGKKSI